jgi:RimJ/RimL family protein N-acetyltransferase
VNSEIYLFYRLDAAMRRPPTGELEDHAFSAHLWKPSLRAPWPAGASPDKKPHFLFRTLLHMTRTFPSRDSGALVLYEAGRLVHYSAFTPRYWRFPFVSGQDLQVGDTWTEPSDRGKGLAKRALKRLVTWMRAPGRNFWYVVEDVNRASVKVAEDCGFRLAGVGTRVKRLKVFDYYEMRTQRPVELQFAASARRAPVQQFGVRGYLAKPGAK